MRASSSQDARKKLFQRGIRRGALTVDEIETALPSGSLTEAERWLLYYSLRAAGVEISCPEPCAPLGRTRPSGTS
ncbi:MAG TPA: RNA polymerase sigma factor region1.1 domain-containing protein [Anaeromyxobacteraceae bacterium]|nr:RNA polymerase sigma factor region1.1 domain-containing protein [Anaeromyxobacteraceae bacterium]